MSDTNNFVVYQGNYKVYQNGDILSIKNNKSPKTKIRQYDGHVVVILYHKSKSFSVRLDTLVAELFDIDKKEGCNFLIHKDGNKENCGDDNLKWVNLKKYLSKI